MERKRTGTMFWSCVLLAALLVLSGCGGESGEETKDGGDPQVSELPVTGLGIRRAQNFDIQYLADNVKLLTDSAGRELLLVPEGGRAPTEYKDALQVTTPVKRAMFTSATHVSFLGELGEDSLYDSIAVVTTEGSRWNTPQILTALPAGRSHILRRTPGWRGMWRASRLRRRILSLWMCPVRGDSSVYHTGRPGHPLCRCCGGTGHRL